MTCLPVLSSHCRPRAEVACFSIRLSPPTSLLPLPLLCLPSWTSRRAKSRCRYLAPTTPACMSPPARRCTNPPRVRPACPPAPCPTMAARPVPMMSMVPTPRAPSLTSNSSFARAARSPASTRPLLAPASATHASCLRCAPAILPRTAPSTTRSNTKRLARVSLSTLTAPMTPTAP